MARRMDNLELYFAFFDYILILKKPRCGRRRGHHAGEKRDLPRRTLKKLVVGFVDQGRIAEFFISPRMIRVAVGIYDIFYAYAFFFNGTFYFLIVQARVYQKTRILDLAVYQIAVSLKHPHNKRFYFNHFPAFLQSSLM